MSMAMAMAMARLRCKLSSILYLFSRMSHDERYKLIAATDGLDLSSLLADNPGLVLSGGLLYAPGGMPVDEIALISYLAAVRDAQGQGVFMVFVDDLPDGQWIGTDRGSAPPHIIEAVSHLQGLLEGL